MELIYEPRGRAREYSPLALNLYTGCVHGCRYCYAPASLRKNPEEYHAHVERRKRVLHHLRNSLAKHEVTRQVLLSFSCDPYPFIYGEPDLSLLTRDVLVMFLAHRVPFAILTKGGLRTLRDLDVIVECGKLAKMGATLVFWNEGDCLSWEPQAQAYDGRAKALKTFHDQGVKTFASLEPVIDPRQSIEIIEDTLEFVDQYKLGKLNHMPDIEAGIDWHAYLDRAVSVLREAGKEFYVKHDLAEAAPGIKLKPRERDCDALAISR